MPGLGTAQDSATGPGRASGLIFPDTVELDAMDAQEFLKRRAEGETLTSMAKSYGVAISMISRL